MARGVRSVKASGFDLGGKRRRSTLSMAPLIDFTFILLIFFMVVTQFDRFTTVDVSMQKSARNTTLPPLTAEKGEMERSLHLVIREDGRFVLNGKDIGDIQSFAGVLRERVTEMKEGNAPLLFVEPEAAVSMQLFIDALNTLKALHGFSMRIVSPVSGSARTEERAESTRGSDGGLLAQEEDVHPAALQANNSGRDGHE